MKKVNKGLKKALFLDRDGVINENYGYVHSADNCDFVDGIQEVLKRAKAQDYLIIVVTNQSGIGRGYYTEEQFHQFMVWMNAQLDNHLSAIYYCPFHGQYGKGKYKKISPDRKPEAGMLFKAMADHCLDPKQSLLIGDSEKDIIAAQRAGLKHAFYYTQSTSCQVPSSSPDEIITIRTLHEVTPYLI